MEQQDYILSYEEFLDQCGDYVSEILVTDTYWFANEPFIKETIFNLYRLYEKTVMKIDGIYYTSLSTKVAGKILESVLSNLIKFNYTNNVT